jgi:hypothetical protein
MTDELERLQEVARAAAALIKADDESTARIRGPHDQTEPPPVDELREIHRLSSIYFARRADLVAALARLAELDRPTE